MDMTILLHWLIRSSSSSISRTILFFLILNLGFITFTFPIFVHDQLELFFIFIFHLWSFNTWYLAHLTPLHWQANWYMYHDTHINDFRFADGQARAQHSPDWSIFDPSGFNNIQIYFPGFRMWQTVTQSFNFSGVKDIFLGRKWMISFDLFWKKAMDLFHVSFDYDFVPRELCFQIFVL